MRNRCADPGVLGVGDGIIPPSLRWIYQEHVMHCGYVLIYDINQGAQRVKL